VVVAPPAIVAPRFLRRYVFIGFAVIVFVSATALGLQLGAFIALKSGHASTGVIESVKTPDARVPATWVNLVRSAHVSILLATESLSSEQVATALVEAASHGVDVDLILPAQSNQNARAGVRGFLSGKGQRASVRVWLDPVGSRGTSAIIDGRIVVLSGAPIAVADEAARTGGHWVFFDDARIAHAHAATLEAWRIRSLAAR